ncbi:hypothetical protein U9M48_044663 [Paspalum notatum var. saurae]|uniref:Uncharacterized protein n=1 Tax=Paspalum notatum var. saurae TaxID=547442 RepID=A0AAQ3XJR3_PASNO
MITVGKQSSCAAVLGDQQHGQGIAAAREDDAPHVEPGTARRSQTRVDSHVGIECRLVARLSAGYPRRRLIALPVRRPFAPPARRLARRSALRAAGCLLRPPAGRPPAASFSRPSGGPPLPGSRRRPASAWISSPSPPASAAQPLARAARPTGARRLSSDRRLCVPPAAALLRQPPAAGSCSSVLLGLTLVGSDSV